MQKQDGKQRALLLPTQIERLTAGDNLKRTEDPKLHRDLPPR